VVTEGTRTAVPRMMIGVKKDGKRLQESFHHSDQEGAFRLLLNSGPGDYQVYAQPSHGFDEAGELLAGRFGKRLQLRGGEELELELEVFEPIVLPLRVVDEEGRPVKSISRQASFQIEGGARYGSGDSSSLDEEGRTALRFHFPLKKLSLEVCAFPEGPKVKVGPFTPGPGEALPETLVTLPRTCELRAVLVDPSGNPHREAQVLIEGHYAGKIKESFYARTDRDGVFSKTGCIRAAPLTLNLTLQGATEPWKSVPLDASGRATLDLGRLVMKAGSAAK
jgi:hypothetical protein